MIKSVFLDTLDMHYENAYLSNADFKFFRSMATVKCLFIDHDLFMYTLSMADIQPSCVDSTKVDFGVNLCILHLWIISSHLVLTVLRSIMYFH